MYNEELHVLPKNTEHFWSLIREQFRYARDALEDIMVEEREDALRSSPPERLEIIDGVRGMALIKYRDVGDGVDNRDYFLEMGRELCPKLEELIARKKLSMEFVQEWGKLLFCHGFIASYILDDADSFAQIRGGHETAKARSRNKQRQWLAHLLLPLLDAKVKRSVAEERVAKYILSLKTYPNGFDRNWFQAMVKRGELLATYDAEFLQSRPKSHDSPSGVFGDLAFWQGPSHEIALISIWRKDMSHADGSAEIERLLTYHEAANKLGIPYFKIQRAARQGLLPTYRLLNGRRYVKVSDIQDRMIVN